jgi:hypothetical protein
MVTELGTALADNVPVSINDTYGDPFIVEQLPNTIMKADALQTQKRPIAIFTKAPYRDDIVDGLRRVAENPMVIPFYSLTGLNEGGYTPENRRRMIDVIHEVFGRVVILTRPIIADRNDDPQTLRMIVDVAADTSKLLVLGGLHDKHKKKRLKEDVETTLVRMCDDAGVRSFHKSSCCGAYMYGQDCWIHDIGDPENLDVVDALGYRYTISNDNRIVLRTATTGDLNFLRIVTRSEVYAEEIVSNYNLLSINTGDQKYESTSSWFAWARNIDTCVGCNYCIILQIEYLKKSLVAIGTHPREIMAHVQAGEGVDFSKFRLTKMAKDSKDFRTYTDVRVPKPCRAHSYATAVEYA